MMRYTGIDIGSRSVKTVVYEESEMTESFIIDTSVFYREHCKIENGRLYLDSGLIKNDDENKICSTGYGRNNINLDGAVIINELKAHMYGALSEFPLQNCTILDIGGQDSKVIYIKNRLMEDILLNDKCAASCGRYLENMSTVLGLTLDELSKHSANPVNIDSKCAVFSESELIGKISEGYNINELAAGINYSLFKRILPMLKRYSQDELIITGGVARNNALIKIIKNEGGFNKIHIPKRPELCGAIGCVALLKKKGMFK
jgi:predicted CoA-substrate-specific enzyme activase